jgi:hypothetical protein
MSSYIIEPIHEDVIDVRPEMTLFCRHLQKSWNIPGLVFVKFVRSILSALSILAFGLADNRFLEEVVSERSFLLHGCPPT